MPHADTLGLQEIFHILLPTLSLWTGVWIQRRPFGDHGRRYRLEGVEKLENEHKQRGG